MSRALKICTMKYLVTICLASFLAVAALGQKVARVSVTTSEPASTSLQKCVDAAKEVSYGSKDVDKHAGKATLWRSVSSLGGNLYEFDITINSEVSNGKTIYTFRMAHVPGVLVNFTKELKRYVAKLKLPDMVVGEYFDGIE